MKIHFALLGALLIAAPVFSQQPAGSQQDDILGLQLTETAAQLEQVLGRPTLVVPAGDLESWQYQIGVEDNHEFSHILLLRVSTGELLSVTRNWEHERTVDEFFPEGESKVYYYPNAQHAEYGVRVRRLTGGRVLIAMGSTKAGQPTGQMMMIRESELPLFHPWLKLDRNLSVKQ